MAWQSLIALLQEARDPAVRNRAGSQCPNDGVTLRSGPNGQLCCPFDGWRGTANEALWSPSMPAAVPPPVPPPPAPDLYEPVYATTY